MSVQATSSETNTNQWGWCRKRKHPSEASSKTLPLPSPLFSSTTPRRRWIESLKTAGTQLKSKMSAQGARIRSLWNPPEVKPPSIPASVSTLSVQPFVPKKISDSSQKLIEFLKNFEMDDEDVEEGLENLIGEGADPWEKDSTGKCAIEYAIRYEYLDGLKILTQTTSHKAFDSCKNFHDFFAVLFPPYKDRFPPKWEQYAEKTPKSAELLRFESGAIPQIECKIKNRQAPFSREDLPKEELDKLLIENPGTNSLEILVSAECNLPQYSSHTFDFQQAWELANSPQKVTLLEPPDAAFSCGGKRILNKEGDGAFYEYPIHTISINKEGDWETKRDSLIFETFNALQRSTFQELESRHPEREEFAFCEEWIETNSSIWTKVFYGSTNFTYSRQEKEAFWINENTLAGPSERFISHTDNYRHFWDSNYAIKYLEKNPEFLKMRLQELETVSISIQEATELKSGKKD